MRVLLSLCFGLIICLELSNGDGSHNETSVATGCDWDKEAARCRPRCKPQCGQNSFCYERNICQCNIGYHEQDGVCKPLCEPSCGEHSECIAPNKCKCDAGYNWNATIKKCVAKCTTKCGIHAYCKEPDLCACIDGYREPFCRPICAEGCEPHGICVSPGHCQCAHGYYLAKNQTCLTQCSPKCGQHSFCYRPNECKCLKGFKPDDPRSLTCSLPLNWWIYLIIAVITIIIICSVVGILCHYVRSRNVNYYPNSSYQDNARIIQ